MGLHIKKTHVKAFNILTCLILPSLVYSSDLPIHTITLKPKKVVSIKHTFMGVLKPLHESLIQARAEGTVSHIYVSDGEKVQKGDLLLDIADKNEQLKLDSAEANYKRALSNSGAQAFRFERVLKLYQSKSISESRYRTEKAKYDAAQSVLGVATSELNQAKLRKKHTHVKAPMSGIIYQKKVLLHSLVSEGTPLFVLSGIKAMKVTVPVPVQYRANLSPKMTVLVQNTHTKQSVTSTINTISPIANHRTRSVDIYINLKPIKGWYLGSSVKVVFTLQKKSAYIIPVKSIVYKRGGPDVFVIKQGYAVPHSIHILKINQNNAWVESAELNEGMIVASEGAERLYMNARVSIKNQR